MSPSDRVCRGCVEERGECKAASPAECRLQTNLCAQAFTSCHDDGLYAGGVCWAPVSHVPAEIAGTTVAVRWPSGRYADDDGRLNLKERVECPNRGRRGSATQGQA